ncbi:hypothetical protein BO70DRAFT_400648 [Aspergillus heteromorphus CBS 117.55]|uniref:Protein kinase domain-containing protein n=1 Tax=Aspergillus heteromorphus CBS 117.55 TaxID=1448321 RepID=A0A317UYN7_9EURO|nr:uncharacterized protein BO70DRAFT_400648 [Aspergillus heteromorphus CBS 117.55]PWY67183.1 hypothetical protein BO70DRAFT_400648 [Aspergillus heteromorphus CBS 117.55]
MNASAGRLTHYPNQGRWRPVLNNKHSHLFLPSVFTCELDFMEEEIRKLQLQLREEQHRREEEQRRREVAEQLQEEEAHRRKEAEKRQEESEQLLQPNSLYGLLDECHRGLSQRIRVQSNASLTTQGETTNPVNRRFPTRIQAWQEFPQSQETIWDRLSSDQAFVTQRQFSSTHQLDYVQRNLPLIYSETSLRTFHRDTVDNFVGEILQTISQNEHLRRRFGIEGQVILEDRANTDDSAASLAADMEQMQVREPARSRRSRGRRGRAGRVASAAATAPTAPNRGPRRRRNRRADQFCVQVAAEERRTPVYAVEFKAPHKLTLPELTAGLRDMEPARDVIDQEGASFEFHATHLVAAVLTQVFSYMLDIGVRRGLVCTGEAYVFLDIPADDPSLLQYYLCVPNQDVDVAEEDVGIENGGRMHRTAVGQMLAFTLGALATPLPSQEWHDSADVLPTWKVEYLDVLRDIPESMRKDPPESNYRPSSWKAVQRSPYLTRSRASCQPPDTTPEHTSGEHSSGDDEMGSPSPAPPSMRQGHGGGRRGGGAGGRTGGRESGRHGGRQDTRGATDQNDRFVALLPCNKSTVQARRYCTIKCIHGLSACGPLDERCPNMHEHGQARHPFGAREFLRRLRNQLRDARTAGLTNLHIRGRTGFMIQATLLSHGYTVIIKATTEDRRDRLRREMNVYQHLLPLQGLRIPVCVGHFHAYHPYWYHGERLTEMMVLSWAGVRIQQTDIGPEKMFWDDERRKLVNSLREHGIQHNDVAWRNLLWNPDHKSVFMIDFESVSSLANHDVSGRQPLRASSGNHKLSTVTLAPWTKAFAC